MWGVSFTHPVLPLFLCGEFLLHIPCCLHFYAESFSYTSCAALIFMQGVSLTHPVLVSFFKIILSGELYLGNFSYSSRAVLIFMQGVSLTHPVQVSLLGEFLLHIPCWLHFYLGSFSYTYYYYIDHFYIALFSAHWADSLHSHVILQEWIAFYRAFFEYPPKWCTYSTGMAGATRICCQRESISACSVYTIQLCTMSLHAKPHM